MLKPPRTLAVVVNWNSRADTLTCLVALARSEPVAPNVIVVDNASSDGSVAAVRAAFPAVEVIENKRNLHFARGANQGLRRAVERGAACVWVLNPDAVVTPGALAEMLRVTESYPALGIVGAGLVQPAPRSRAGERENVGGRCDLPTSAIIEPPAPSEATLD